MTANFKWGRLIAFALFAEVFILSYWFGLPALQGRAFFDLRFPRVIVFHQFPRATPHERFRHPKEGIGLPSTRGLHVITGEISPCHSQLGSEQPPKTDTQ